MSWLCVPKHGTEALGGILQMVKHTDFETTELSPGQSLPRRARLHASFAREGVTELNTAETRRGEARHVYQQRAVTEAELEDGFFSKLFRVQRKEPFEEL